MSVLTGTPLQTWGFCVRGLHRPYMFQRRRMTDLAHIDEFVRVTIRCEPPRSLLDELAISAQETPPDEAGDPACA
jgi:hypothetical protein